MFHRLALVPTLLLVVAMPLSAQDKKVTLAWKFEKDKTFYQKMTTTTDQTMKVMNNEVKQKQEQTFYFSWTPKKQDGDTWTIVQKIEGVNMSIDIGGSKVNYDSTKETQAQNALGDFFKALVGSEFTLTLDTKTGKVTKVDGRKEFVDKLTAANKQMEPLLKQILSDEALKEMATPTFGFVPKDPQAKGGKWKTESTLDMGPIGKYQNTYNYTLEGVENDTATIKVETTLQYTPPSDSASGVGGLPFKIKSADLKSTDASGEITFDNKAGRVNKSSMKMDLKGELSIEIGGQTTKVDLSQTQETKVETSDKQFPELEKKK